MESELGSLCICPSVYLFNHYWMFGKIVLVFVSKMLHPHQRSSLLFFFKHTTRDAKAAVSVIMVLANLLPQR